jgi:hypothetical protein
MRTKLVLVATLCLALPAFARRDVEHSFHTTVPRGKVQRVVIAVPYGSFTIRNGATDRLTAAGIASRDYDTEKERVWAQGVVDDTSVGIEINGAEAVVRRKFGKGAQSWRAKRFTGIDLRLDLPAGVDVSFDTSFGEIDLAGDFGDLDIDLRAGEIDVRVPKTRVRELNASCRVGEVHTNLGHEIITREGLFPGTTHFFNADGTSHVNVHTTAGEVRVTLLQ